MPAVQKTSQTQSGLRGPTIRRYLHEHPFCISICFHNIVPPFLWDFASVAYLKMEYKHSTKDIFQVRFVLWEYRIERRIIQTLLQNFR